MKTYTLKPDSKSADVQVELDKIHGPGRAKIERIDWAAGTAYYELAPQLAPPAAKDAK